MTNPENNPRIQMPGCCERGARTDSELYTGDVDDVARDELARLQSLYAAVTLPRHLRNLRLVLLQRLDRALRVSLLQHAA